MCAVRLRQHRPVEGQRRVRQLRQRTQDRLPALHGRVAAEPEKPAERRMPLRDARERVDVDPVPDRAHLRRAERDASLVHRQQRVDDARRGVEQRAASLLREPKSRGTRNGRASGAAISA